MSPRTGRHRLKRTVRSRPQALRVLRAPPVVLADEDLFAALPSALDAWVRFAGRKRGIAEWAIETTRDAIPH